MVAAFFLAEPRVTVATWSRSPSCLISTCWVEIFSAPLREVCQDAHHCPDSEIWCEGLAGRRTVPFSDIIKAELADHFKRLDPDDDQALVFTSPMGTPLRHSNFYRRAWLPAVAKVALPGIHLHDMRHAGNTLTADAGASLRELMDRMGHSGTRAALIYQHSSDERQRKLADAVGEAARAALLKTELASGTHVAREASDQS